MSTASRLFGATCTLDGLYRERECFLHARWEEFLAQGISAQQAEQLRINTSTGRPTGSAQFVKMLEEQTGRVLRAIKPGPKTTVNPNRGPVRIGERLRKTNIY